MRKTLPLLLLLILSYFSVRPLLSHGYFPMHDDTQVERVVEMGRALKNAQFPVRWVADLGYGYGYPIFNFYGPLPYYFGGLLYAFGAPALVATKVMFGAGIVLPSVLLYFVVVPVIGWSGALITSSLYLFAPYHAVQAYVRGAVGEYWILLFWPLLLYALLWSQDPKKRKSVILVGSLGLAGSIISHTLLGYVTTVVLITLLSVFWVWKLLHREEMGSELKVHAQVTLLGLGVSAFFWLPALLEMRYTNVSAQISSSANYLDHFVCWTQLWSSQWGYGGSAPGCIRDGLSFMLGKVHILLGIFAIFGLLMGWVVNPHRRFVSIAIICTVIGVIFSTAVSEPFWRVIPMFSYLQYPWRFLAIAAFGLSLLGGLSAVFIRHPTWRFIFVIVVLCSTLYLNAKWFVPQYMYEITSRDFESVQDIRWRASKISDEYLPPDIIRPTDESRVISATIVSRQPISVTPIITTDTKMQFVVESTMAGELTINIATFPGWRYELNGRPVAPIIHAGLPTLTVYPGQSVITAQLSDTPVRIIGNFISGLSVVVLFFIYGKQQKTKR